MKHIVQAIGLSALVMFSVAAQSHSEHAAAPTQTVTALSAAHVNTQLALRDLWVEHVFWVRNYVLASKAGDVKQVKSASEQVLVNATSICAAIAGFYGKAAGDQLLTLLAGHWGAVKEYTDASFSGDVKIQENATAKLVANAKEIAVFLAKANPHLPEASLVGLLSSHGAHHLAQAKQIAKGDYAGEAATWADMRIHMHIIADAMTGALAKQFPEKFR